MNPLDGLKNHLCGGTRGLAKESLSEPHVTFYEGGNKSLPKENVVRCGNARLRRRIVFDVGIELERHLVFEKIFLSEP
jgi:hypothetical protein